MLERLGRFNLEAARTAGAISKVSARASFFPRSSARVRSKFREQTTRTSVPVYPRIES